MIGLERRQRLSAPVNGNVGKEPLLDLIPLAGGRRQVAKGDGQASLGGKLLDLLLPEPVA